MASYGAYFKLLRRAVFKHHSRQLLGATCGLSIAIQLKGAYNSCDSNPSVLPQLIESNDNKISIPMTSLYSIEEKSLSTLLQENFQIVRHNISVAIRYCRRILQYIMYGTPAIILTPAAYYLQDISPFTEDLIWSYLIWTIEQLGPTFVKFAQWASTRPDLYPPQLIERLLRLQDQVTVKYSFATVESTLSESFGPQWKQQLKLDPKPIGAGCIAQVFQGELKDPNQPNKIQKVAVKLIHPQVEQLVKTDMELLGIIANLMDRNQTLELLSFGDSCRQFASMMRDQLDLRIEAYHLRKFSELWAQEKWASFPMPIDGYVHKNVLVETLMHGTPLSEYTSGKIQELPGQDLNNLKLKLSDLGCRAIIKMIFFDNLVHGDLHPGNILVQIQDNGEPHMVFLDCGIAFSSKTPEDHFNLVEVCFSFMKHEGREAGRRMMDRNPERYSHLNKEIREQNTIEFCNGLQKMIDDSENSLFFENFNKYVNQICDLARTYSIKLDPSYFQVAMALKIIEGNVLSLNRDIDIISKCVPIVMKTQAMRALGVYKFPLPEDHDTMTRKGEKGINTNMNTTATTTKSGK